MKITIEKRAFLTYILMNFALGLIIALVLLMPTYLFHYQILYYIIIILVSVETCLILKVDYDGYKFGLVEGFKKNLTKRMRERLSIDKK